MEKFTKKSLEKEIVKKIKEQMLNTDPSSEEFSKLVSSLNNLERKKLSSDTIALIVTNLLGILIIVAYEHRDIIPRGAFSLVRRV